MRRQVHRRSDAMVRSQEGEQGFWPSYADMMSAVALILFFLMLLSYIQNLITGNDLRDTQDKLASTLEELAGTRTALSETQLELTDTQDKLIITLGISGSVQFAAGMRTSDRIIAVNTDPNASIFNIAHDGFVGDLYEIVPELIRMIGEEN